MTQLLCFVPDDDGYSENAYIEGVPRIHPPVRIRFRPTRSLDRVSVTESIRGKSAETAEQAIIKEVADRIVDWSIVGADGEKVDPTADFILRLKAPLYRRLVSIVFYGTDGGDVDPHETATEAAEKRRRAAVLADEGIDGLGQDRKN